MSTSPFESLYLEELYELKSPTVVIISKSWEEVTEEEQLLLSKILGAVKLNMAAIQILALKEFDIADLKKVYQLEQVIAFGSVCKGESRLYEVVSINGVALLQADALSKLDDARKKSLWGGLKQMFTR